MRSPWSVGILMIVMGGIGLSGFSGQRPSGIVPYLIAGLLIGGGATLFLRRPFAFWVALAASVVLAVSGLLARFGYPMLALPIPPILSIVVGLYLCLRVLMAKSALKPRKRQGADSLGDDSSSPT